MPSWFKTILKSSHNICQFTDNRGFRLISQTINQKVSYVHWHGVTPQDIQATITNGAVGAGGNSSTNASKYYMFNHQVDHVWKNNTNTAAIMEFYKLVPRRDLPVWLSSSASSASATQVIAPPNTYNYADAGRANPNMYTQGMADMLPGAVGAGTGTKIDATDVEATPYMSPPMASFFKIVPLRVNGPNGRSPFQTIAPGTQATLSVKHSKPRLCNYAKYGLTSLDNEGNTTIPATYEVLRETPLIFCYIRGGIGHEKSTATPPVPTTSVGVTQAAVDYMRKSHWKRVIVATGAQQSVRLVAPATFTNAAKETNEFQTEDVEEDLV